MNFKKEEKIKNGIAYNRLAIFMILIALANELILR